MLRAQPLDRSWKCRCLCDPTAFCYFFFFYENLFFRNRWVFLSLFPAFPHPRSQPCESGLPNAGPLRYPMSLPQSHWTFDLVAFADVLLRMRSFFFSTSLFVFLFPPLTFSLAANGCDVPFFLPRLASLNSVFAEDFFFFLLPPRLTVCSSPPHPTLSLCWTSYLLVQIGPHRSPFLPRQPNPGPMSSHPPVHLSHDLLSLFF